MLRNVIFAVCSVDLLADFVLLRREDVEIRPHAFDLVRWHDVAKRCIELGMEEELEC